VLIMLFSLMAIRIIIRPYYREMEDLNASLQYSNQQLEETNAKLTVSNRNLTTVYEVGLGMRHSLALRDILDLIVTSAHQALGVDRVALFLPSADAKQLELRSSAGAEQPQVDIRVPLSAQGGALGAAFQRKESVRVEEGQKIPAGLRLGPPASTEPFLRSRAFVAVPLVVKDRAVGVIAVDNKVRRGTLGEDQVGLLGIFANQAAVAVDNARLYDQLRQKIQELDARVDQLSILHQIGNSMQRDITRQEALGFILRGILEGIGFAGVAVALVDRQARELRGELGLGQDSAAVGAIRVPLGAEEHLLVRAVSRRGPVGIVHSAQSGLAELIGRPLGAEGWRESLGTLDPEAKAAVVAVPLIAREEVVGVIAAVRTTPPVIRRHEVELLLLYANTAGLTIERAELYARMHRDLESLEVTDRVSGLFTGQHGRMRTREELAAAATGSRPLAGLLLAVDALEGYNERCGHELGDLCLAEIGEILKGAVRPGDSAFRYGGRLLAATLPGATGGQAAAVAEAIRNRLRLHRFPGPHGARDQQLTLSVGLVAWAPERLPTEAEHFRALLANLRQAEAGGGDRVQASQG
jgi:diguanylate cyclase (GGDEF)-like protein